MDQLNHMRIMRVANYRHESLSLAYGKSLRNTERHLTSTLPF